MKLWLVCFLLLFFGAEAAQWLSQLAWASSTELSLPLTLAGGISLAIASNYRHWPRFSPPSPPPAPPPLASPPPMPTVQPPAPTPQARGTQSQGDTISFEIKKPQGKG